MSRVALAFASDYPRRVPVPTHFLVRPEMHEPTSAIHLLFFQRRATRGVRFTETEAPTNPAPHRTCSEEPVPIRPVARVRLPSEPGSVSLRENREPSRSSDVAQSSEEPEQAVLSPNLAIGFERAPPPFAALVSPRELTDASSDP